MGEEGVAKLVEEKGLDPLIYLVRRQRVILDADLARLYGASTKRFNEAMRRNRERFPEDFAFRLTDAEFANLRAFARDKQAADLTNKKSMWSQFATTSGRRRRAIDRPWAFTEHGALMAANVLRSDAAIRMSIYVIRAFVRLREEAATRAGFLRRLAEIDSTLLAHDDALRDLYQKLMPLLAPPPEPPKRRIGFHTGDE